MFPKTIGRYQIIRSNRSGRDAVYAGDLDSGVEAQLNEPRPGERRRWPEWCGADKLVSDIYIYDVVSGGVRNLTAGWPSDEMHPSWRK